MNSLPQGALIRYRNGGEVHEAKFCSFYYDTDSIKLNVQKDNEMQVVNGGTVYLRRKKGTYTKDQVDVLLLQEEVQQLRQEVAAMKEKITFITKAIKLLRQR